MDVTFAGLVDPHRCRASCGVAALVDLGGKCSHEIVDSGLVMLERLAHRGARGAEETTGDGAGMLLQLPHDFFSREVPRLPDGGRYAVGQVFLPKAAAANASLRGLIDEAVRHAGWKMLAWREVPTDASALGRSARLTEPAVWQFFTAPGAGVAHEHLDAHSYMLRRQIERRIRAECPDQQAYICSLDRQRIVYKGLLTASQLRGYFPELSDPLVRSALVLVHARFSTNTLGAWPLAHPYRCVVHNGEFNTLRGNRNWMRAREAALASSRLGPDIEALKPVVADDASDSASFDSVLELLLAGGRSLPHALRMMIPEAWQRDARMESARRDFYDYHAAIMEPWDGPALVVATDGEQVAAVLDRNGLRPCRIWLTDDRRLIIGSETGLLDVPPERIVRKGRLKPGELLLADTRSGRIIDEAEVFGRLCARPYGCWLAQHRLRLPETPRVEPALDGLSRADLVTRQRAFGYTLEVIERLMLPMAEDGKDPLGAMGDDAPPAFLSQRRRPIFHYFNQLFAQVSNPPIDFMRELLMTSLESRLGPQRNLLDARPEHCARLCLDSPILDGAGFDALGRLGGERLHACTVSICFDPATSLRDALGRLTLSVREGVAGGCEVVILSDRDIGPERVAIPSLIAIGAVHHDLIRHGLRTSSGLVVDSGDPCAVHHFCTLIGYGADAVHPWLAYRTVADSVLTGEAGAACRRYREAAEYGILKVMSKMGISTLEGYKGAQIFEALGLDDEVIERCFAGTPCAVPGVGFDVIERDVRDAHVFAFGERLAGGLALEQGGEYYWRRDGEVHAWSPYAIGRLQQAARTGDATAYDAFAKWCNEGEGRRAALRGLLDFVPSDSAPLALDDVENEQSIMRRFSTGSMSFGALSRETHEALAVAMNRIGGKSGSGEGGEHAERFGTERACSMKQVASGRFGVTIRYLADARQIEIKMAQGAKPGEGGELPSAKVDAGIAAARCTTPGVGLISPPPHHDIYSIEDLAQLIFDLRCANPEAEIHVKLVAVAGVGTIAAGVAKAGADAVLISGDSGGTGAALKTSIKSAGGPWEQGLAETQQVLLANNLRSRIRVRVDGGLRTGRDVAIAALLGAEEYGFGTAPLVALGCIMLRKCHCNTCSVGIATQDPALRALFAGEPGHVVNYLRLVAGELRDIMARLGFRSLDEMTGRVDCLRPAAFGARGGCAVDLSRLLYRPPSDDAPRKLRAQTHRLAEQPDHALIREAEPALARGEPVRLSLALRNHHRSVGAMLSHAVVRRRGREVLAPDTIVVRCTGSAGQSFGAFLVEGVSLYLCGDANDYLGKGLSGGRIVVATPPEASFEAADNIVIGNVALYGATAGEAYINGLAGERFAVRNSGVLAVVEGVGEHACEYMTGGVIVVLGATGRNFGAGMSGGEAYVLDADGDFEQRVNSDMVRLEALETRRDRELVRRLVANHRIFTGSRRAGDLLDEWPHWQTCFIKVMPVAYAEAVARALDEGRDIRPAVPAAAWNKHVAAERAP